MSTAPALSLSPLRKALEAIESVVRLTAPDDAAAVLAATMSSSESLNSRNFHPNANHDHHHHYIRSDNNSSHANAHLHQADSSHFAHHRRPAAARLQPPSRDPAAPFDRILNPPERAAAERNSPCPNFFFNNAFHPSSSPPPPNNFLDNILNPADSSFLPFGYTNTCFPPLHQGTNPPLPQDGSLWLSSAMPQPPQRTRPSRLANGYVDLTSESSVANPAPRRSKPLSPSPGPSAKRLKRADGSSSQKPASKPPAADIEEVDLSDDRAAMRDTLEKQRADAVKAQQKPDEKPTTFNSFTCVICMEIPENITATSCGHLFCHTCLMEALIAGENRAAPGEPKRSQCPVCRKHINRTKQSDVIPLALKKGLLTQPRKNFSISSPKVP